MSNSHDDERTDEVWRDIVANFGERVRLDDEPATDTRPPDEPVAEPVAESVTYELAPEPDPDPVDDVREVERFRPPPPPPVPFPSTWQRAIAWAGVTVVPVVGLIVALLRVYLPSPLGLLLVAWCVGGFVYLAVIAPRSPRDPWDDGSRI